MNWENKKNNLSGRNAYWVYMDLLLNWLWDWG